MRSLPIYIMFLAQALSNIKHDSNNFIAFATFKLCSYSTSKTKVGLLSDVREASTHKSQPIRRTGLKMSQRKSATQIIPMTKFGQLLRCRRLRLGLSVGLSPLYRYERYLSSV